MLSLRLSLRQVPAPAEVLDRAAALLCPDAGEQCQARDIGVVDLSGHLGPAALMHRGERLAEQRPRDPTAPVGRQDGDQPEPGPTGVHPHPGQADVPAAGHVDGHQVGGRVEAAGLVGLLAEIAWIPDPAVRAWHVLAQRHVEQPQVVLVDVGGRDDDHVVTDDQPVKAGQLRIGRNHVVALATELGEAERRQPVLRGQVIFLGHHVQVSVHVVGDRRDQRGVAVVAAVVEPDEPSVVGPQVSTDGPDRLADVERSPVQSRRDARDPQLRKIHSPGR